MRSDTIVGGGGHAGVPVVGGVSGSKLSVSVIIPCYNNARTIGLSVRSIAAQTYPPDEIIVVDDASIDGSADVAESAGATVLRLPTNRGPSTARNRGAERAAGQILFFLDGDITLDPGSIAAAVAALRSAPHLGAICGVCLPESLLTRGLVSRYRTLQLHHWGLSQEGPITDLHTALFAIRATVFREIGPFNPRLRHTEAPEYARRLRQRYEIHATAAIAGRHDHDATLRVLLPKVFHRARASALEWGQGEIPGGGGATRVLASALVLASVLALPLPVLAGPLGAAAAPLLIAAAVGLDAGTYRRVVASDGVVFGCYFTAIHLLYHLTAAAGAGLGFAQRMLGRRTDQPTTADLPATRHAARHTGAGDRGGR